MKIMHPTVQDSSIKSSKSTPTCKTNPVHPYTRAAFSDTRIDR